MLRHGRRGRGGSWGPGGGFTTNAVCTAPVNARRLLLLRISCLHGNEAQCKKIVLPILGRVETELKRKAPEQGSNASSGGSADGAKAPDAKAARIGTSGCAGPSPCAGN